MTTSTRLVGHPVFREPLLLEKLGARVLAAAEEGLGGESPRFMAWIFTDDRAGVLHSVVRALHEGFESSSNPEGRIRFNIEASLTVSIAHLGSIALVVQPLILDDLSDEQAPDSAEPQEYPAAEAENGLSEILWNALFEHGLTRHQARITIDRLPDRANELLFAERVLREYRFAPVAAVTTEEEAISTLQLMGATLAEVSETIASYDIPIPYFHFPHNWAGPKPCEQSADDRIRGQWLRVAFAARPELFGDQAELDMKCAAIAARRGLALAVFDAFATEQTRFSDKFVLVSPIDPTEVPIQSLDAGDLACAGVLVAGKARVGFVRDVMAGTGSVAVGGSMAVLYGQSVIMLAVPASSAEQVKQGLLERTDSTDYRVFQVKTAADDRRLKRSESNFWVAWVCKETAGVVRAVLDTVQTVVKSEFGDSEGMGPNVVYSISRVLSDGYSCAGKIKFSLVGIGGERFAPTFLTQVESAIRASLKTALGWTPPRTAWSDRPIAVSESEPTEEPWATLAALGATLDSL